MPLFRQTDVVSGATGASPARGDQVSLLRFVGFVGSVPPTFAVRDAQEVA